MLKLIFIGIALALCVLWALWRFWAKEKIDAKFDGCANELNDYWDGR